MIGERGGRLLEPDVRRTEREPHSEPDRRKQEDCAHHLEEHELFEIATCRRVQHRDTARARDEQHEHRHRGADDGEGGDAGALIELSRCGHGAREGSEEPLTSRIGIPSRA